ncbi:hypothetical protein XPA_004364 [Xanthoria parietina]
MYRELAAIGSPSRRRLEAPAPPWLIVDGVSELSQSSTVIGQPFQIINYYCNIARENLAKPTPRSPILEIRLSFSLIKAIARPPLKLAHPLLSIPGLRRFPA